MEAVNNAPAEGPIPSSVKGTTATSPPAIKPSHLPAIDPGDLTLRPVISPPDQTPALCLPPLRRKISSLLSSGNVQPVAAPSAPSTSQGRLQVPGSETPKKSLKKRSMEKLRAVFTGGKSDAKTSPASSAPAAGASLIAMDGQARPLPPATLTAQHPRHGTLSINRLPKAAGSREVRFELELRSPSGPTLRGGQTMVVTLDDANYQDHSTLGYCDIHLGAMQGKGAGTLLHLMAAQTARELGAQKFVVETVLVDGPMDHLCQKMDMIPVNLDGYEADPAALEARCLERAAAKGWSLAVT